MKKVFFAVAVFAFLLTSRALGVTYTVIDLHPSGFYRSYACGTGGNKNQRTFRAHTNHTFEEEKK